MGRMVEKKMNRLIEKRIEKERTEAKVEKMRKSSVLEVRCDLILRKIGILMKKTHLSKT